MLIKPGRPLKILSFCLHGNIQQRGEDVGRGAGLSTAVLLILLDNRSFVDSLVLQVFFVKVTLGYLHGRQCDIRGSRCVMEISGVAASKLLGPGHMTARLPSWPVHPGKHDSVTWSHRNDGEMEKKILGKRS